MLIFYQLSFREQENNTSKTENKVNNHSGGKQQEVQISIQNSANMSDRRNFRSAVDLPTYLKDNEKVPLEIF